MSYSSDIEQLFGTMLQLGKLLSQQTTETHEEKAATILQFLALHYLKDQPNVTVTDLCKFMNFSKSSATQLVERLVKAGLVRRIDDSEDRRIIRLSITESGNNEFIALKKKLIGKMHRIFSKIPQSDLRELIRIHKNLIETFKKEQNIEL